MNMLRVAALAVVLALPGTLVAAQETEMQPGSGKITVTGEGLVDIAPDMATITLGVTTEADTAAAALTENSARVAEVLAQLAAAGIAERDIQTSGLSLNPNVYYGSSGDQKPEITGYTVQNQVTVRVRDLPKLGGVMDSVVQNGANTFNGLAFGLIDPVPTTDEARKRAVADARRKAELFAAAAGVSLGAILSINESTAYAAPMPMFRMEASAADNAVPVAGGEVGISALVTLEFALVQ